MAIPGEDVLRVGAFILFGIAGVLLILILAVGTQRFCVDCKRKRDAKRAAREHSDFDSFSDLGLDERDRCSEGSDTTLFVRPDPVLQELHFPIARANEVHMTDSLQTVGNMSSFVNVGQYNNSKGWGSPSHQALSRASEEIVEASFSNLYDLPAWQTAGNPANPGFKKAPVRQDNKVYGTPRETRLSPAQREMNNFVALQIASNMHGVPTPKGAERKPKGSHLFVPGIQSTSNLTSPNLRNSPIAERRTHEGAAHNERNTHANAFFINGKSRTDHSEFHELKSRENSRNAGKAQNMRIGTKNDDVHEPSRVPVLGKDAEYWNYVTSKAHLPPPDITGGGSAEPKKSGKANKSNKAGKREKYKQHEVKNENMRERAKHPYENTEGFDADNSRIIQGRIERSMSTKKKEDLLVSELKARLGQRQGNPGDGEELMF